jgi:hypothetical protein
MDKTGDPIAIEMHFKTPTRMEEADSMPNTDTEFSPESVDNGNDDTIFISQQGFEPTRQDLIQDVQ